MKIAKCIINMKELEKAYCIAKRYEKISLANVKEVILPKEKVKNYISDFDLKMLHYYREGSEEAAKKYLDALYKVYEIDKSEYRICIMDGEIEKR